MFSEVISRLLMVDSRRFWYAPSFPLTADTYLMAPPTRSMASSAPSLVLTSTFSIPIFCNVIAGISTASIWPSLAPTWSLMAPIPAAITSGSTGGFAAASGILISVAPPKSISEISRRISNPVSDCRVRILSFTEAVVPAGNSGPSCRLSKSTV